MDDEVAREVWQSRIPAEFSLFEDDVDPATMLSIKEKPKNFYLLLPRISYLPVCLDKVLKYFKRWMDIDTGTETPNTENAPDNDSPLHDLWLEYKGEPIKWHYPIGVLVDLLQIDANSLPWRITVHFKNFPDKIMQFPESLRHDLMESTYFQCIKEADQLKHKALIINNMQKSDHKQLWNGIVNDRFDQFWSINKKLLEDSDEHPFRYIPVRLYKPNETNFKQALCLPYDQESNGAKDKRSTLHHCLRGDFGFVNFDPERQIVVSQGIPLPLDTPLLWLSQNLQYPDNFIHLCILEKS